MYTNWGNRVCGRDTDWMMIEADLTQGERAVMPIGITAPHADLRLGGDAILAENAADDAAEPLGVAVSALIPFGRTTPFMAYPGTVSLRLDTLIAVLRDVLGSLVTQASKRIGYGYGHGHGGSAPIDLFLGEWMADR